MRSMFISLLMKLGYKVSSIHHLFLPLPPLLLPFLSDQITNRVQELLTNTRPITIHPVPTITDLQNPITHPDPIIPPQILTSLPRAIGLQIPWQPSSLLRNHNTKFISNSIILLNIYYWRYNPNKAHPQSPSTHHAYLTTSHTNGQDNNSNWILDSDAFNHVTNDINNLSSFYTYEGVENLQIGNGTGLPISNIDFSTLSLFTHTISLHNILQPISNTT
jgi:hypothetical protein